MSTYELQVHSRYLNLPVVPPVTGVARHTGYDLIERDNSGNIISIRSIDLTKTGGKISFEESITNGAAVLSSSIILPNQIKLDDKLVEVSDEIVETYDFLTETLLIGDNAKQVFDWIILDAKFREALGEDSDVGLIDYDVDGPNCNTWTNYVGQKYANISNVTGRFDRGWYPGSSNDFNTGNTTEENNKCILLESYVQKFKNEISSQNYDISNIEIDVKGTSADNWFCIIRNCNIDGTQFTYIYDTNNGSEIKLESNQNSFVYAEDGQNHVTTGSGNDEIHSGKDYDIINAGSGDDYVYAGDGGGQISLDAGNDYFEGGAGADMVNSGQGNDTIYTYAGNDNVDTQIGAHTTDTNHIYLGAGNDNFTGGVGIDIVDGGADDDIVNAGGGNNIVDGGSGNDTIISGSGNDRIYCGTGRDYVDAGLGENHIYLGNDNSNDKVYISGGTNYIYDYSEYDYIELATGLNIVSLSQAEGSKNIVLMLSGGGEIILVEAAKDEAPSEPDPSHPYTPEAAGEMPYIVFPNGNIMGWAPSVGGYVDTGYILPALEGGKHLPDNGEPVIPQIPVPTDDTPPQKPTLKPDDRDPHDLPENEDAPAGSLNDPKSHKLPWNKQPYSGTRLSNVPISWYLPQTPIPEKAQGGFEGSQQDPSPLVLDLDGDGIETISTEEKVYFDHDNNGFAESSGWVGADDGLLVRDINNNGKIDNGTELFGNNSVLSSGAKAAKVWNDELSMAA